MKKTRIAFLLAAAMLLTLLAGCAAEPTIPEEPAVNEEPIVEQPIYFTLDAYGMAGGMLSVTQSGDEGIESIAWGFEGAEGDTLGDVLAAQEITALDAYLDGDELEGWMVYEEIVSTDGEYTYELRSGETIYTTQELMELTVPSYNAAYVAKWASIPVEDYFPEEDYMFDANETTGTFILNAGGGTMSFQSLDGSEEFDSAVYSYWMADGQTINDLAATEEWDTLVSVEKDGAAFTGWTVYEGSSVTWNSEESADDAAMSFPYVVDDPSYEGFEYIHITDCVLYQEGMSTEELLSVANHSKTYYAFANWE